MCGIIGYVGREISTSDILQKLQTLEYRGYDSSGIAYKVNGKIFVDKALGPVKNLIDKTKGNTGSAICHTRWATHGKVCLENAHPQSNKTNTIMIVHNGIIENYKVLKKSVNCAFTSETDSEVIAKLMDNFSGSILDKFCKTINSLEGSYAIACLTDKNNKLYLAKNKSPLYLAKVDGGYLASSDIACFCGKDYYALKDNMVAVVDKNSCEFYQKGKHIKLSITKNKYNAEIQSKNGYSHYMLKEIDETPVAIRSIINFYKNSLDSLNIIQLIKNRKIVISGCGTAYHAGLMGKNWFENNYNSDVECIISSELRYKPNFIDKNSVVVLVSQSGETADVLAVAERAKQNGNKIIAITNVEYSTLALIADVVCPLKANAEISVASTKAYSAMLIVFYLLSNLDKQWNYIENKIKSLLNCSFIDINTSIIDKISHKNRIFYIGRGDDGVNSLEGSLKLREITYKDAHGFFAGELKHGTIALIEKGVLVIAIITNSILKNKTLSAIEEVLSRGADVLLITTDLSIEGDNDIIYLPDLGCELNSVQVAVTLQKIAYQTSVKLGLDPDKPRNLAKSVTVE